MRTISETIRLIILILLLPLALVLIGPLLILAALRGQQGMGPIVWDTSRYNPAGRLGIFGLGLVLWLLIWGGLGWLFLNTSFQPVLAQIIPPTAGPAETGQVEAAAPSPTPPPASTGEGQATATPAQPPTPSPTLPPSSTPTSPALTLTPPQATVTAPPSPEAGTAAELSSTRTPSPTVTATAFTPDPTATGTPTLAVTPTPQPTPTFGERQAAVESVKEANVLLRDAIALANDENIGKLEVVWQGKALIVIENFAIDLYDRYTRPFTVTFEYLKLPASQVQPETGRVVITSQERWSYIGPTTTNQEAFEFIYSLERVNERWVITSYTYRNLPTPTAIPPTMTATPTPQKRP